MNENQLHGMDNIVMVDEVDEYSSSFPNSMEEEYPKEGFMARAISNVQVNEAEVKFAEAMNALSFDEKQLAINDVHGVSTVRDDTEFLDKKLAELEGELSKIPDKKAYYMAKASSPSYVCDRDFRIMFLRSDNFNAKNAAIRLVKHFETKLELFGEDKLGRNIRISDLSSDEIKVLETGYTQLLMQRDRAGRAIIFFAPGGPKGSARRKQRVQWWGLMNTLRDKETQRRGMVCVAFGIKKLGSFDPEAALLTAKLTQVVPMLFSAIHLYLDNPNPLVSMIVNATGIFFQSRFRYHRGSYKEGLYSLMTFGIPVKSLPLIFNEDSCAIANDAIRERIQKRFQQEKESTIKEEDLIVTPGTYDVVLGRSKMCQEHMGNFRYRGLISAHQQCYEEASKKEKSVIANEIVQAVKAYSGRFLKEHYADFIEVSDSKAREKVAHSFRSLRKLVGNNKNKPKMDSSGDSLTPWLRKNRIDGWDSNGESKKRMRFPS